MKIEILKWPLAFIIATLSAVSAASSVQEAPDPITWSYAYKKKEDKLIEVYFKATVKKGWHIYSSKQPKGAISTPTQITIHPGSSFQTAGAIKEVGRKLTQELSELNIKQYFYQDNVYFILPVKWNKDSRPDSIFGTITYMACDDVQCLPDKTINYRIAIK